MGCTNEAPDFCSLCARSQRPSTTPVHTRQAVRSRGEGRRTEDDEDGEQKRSTRYTLATTLQSARWRVQRQITPASSPDHAPQIGCFGRDGWKPRCWRSAQPRGMAAADLGRLPSACCRWRDIRYSKDCIYSFRRDILSVGGVGTVGMFLSGEGTGDGLVNGEGSGGRAVETHGGDESTYAAGSESAPRKANQEDAVGVHAGALVISPAMAAADRARLPSACCRIRQAQLHDGGARKRRSSVEGLCAASTRPC